LCGTCVSIRRSILGTLNETLNKIPWLNFAHGSSTLNGFGGRTDKSTDDVFHKHLRHTDQSRGSVGNLNCIDRTIDDGLVQGRTLENCDFQVKGHGRRDSVVLVQARVQWHKIVGICNLRFLDGIVVLATDWQWHRVRSRQSSHRNRSRD
jgi:hypothetical protein